MQRLDKTTMYFINLHISFLPNAYLVTCPKMYLDSELIKS